MDQETLGQRIRRVRHERGLTLSQVAGGDFSRAFLNQVEMGRSQPSTRVLRVIASRLGAPLDYLIEGNDRALEQELTLERARLALARGRPHRALKLVGPFLDERSELGSEARLTAAQALTELSRAGDALQLVEGEEALLRARGDRYRLRRLGALARGRRATLDAAGHERLGERALREGRRELALEHLRAARILREAGGTPDDAPLAPAVVGPGDVNDSVQ